MKTGRITFHGNPWPEGHPIREFTWSAYEDDGYVWMNFDLSTATYNSERQVEQDIEQVVSDWGCAVVWMNYHSCDLSSDHPEGQGFKVCHQKRFTPAWLHGQEFKVDARPGRNYNPDDLAFQIYLLGHDSCANHKISFQRVGSSNLFDITWTGKIALSYAGEYEFKHDFTAKICGVEFPFVDDDSGDDGCDDAAEYAGPGVGKVLRENIQHLD